MSETAGKICVICGEDCSGRPRTKDRSGRYACQACYERVKAKKRAAPPPPPADDPFAMLGDALGERGAGAEIHVPPPAAGGHPCPRCSEPMAPGAILCVSCGYNERTGEHLETAKEKAKRERSARASADGAVALVLQPGAVALAVYGMYALLGALAASGGDSMLVAFIAWHGLFVLGYGITLLVLAFMESVAQGFLTLCVPCYFIYFVYGVSENAYLKMLFPAYVGGAILYVLVAGPQLDRFGAGGFA